MSLCVIKQQQVGFRPGPTQTNLPITELEIARSLKFRMTEEEGLYYPCSEKKKAQFSFAVTAKLICAFVFDQAFCKFSYVVAQMLY